MDAAINQSILFYDKFIYLCQRKNISPSKAAIDAGISKALVSKWKRTGATPNGDTLIKIATYFNVSVDYLLNHSSDKFPDETDLAVVSVLKRVPPEKQTEFLEIIGRIAELM